MKTLIKSPILTEKSIQEYSEEKKASFVVDTSATKTSAAKELESIYDVTVEKVWVTNRLGKKRMSRTRKGQEKKSSDKKIMIFKIGAKDTIEIFNQ